MVLGRLFCCIPAGFWQFVSSQGGRAPHRGHQGAWFLEQKMGFPNADGDVSHSIQDSLIRKPCVTPPSLDTPTAVKSTAGLTKGPLRLSLCARSMGLPNASFYSWGPGTIQPKALSVVHRWLFIANRYGRGHPSGDGKCGDTSAVVSEGTSETHRNTLSLSDRFLHSVFLLYEKDL